MLTPNEHDLLNGDLIRLEQLADRARDLVADLRQLADDFRRDLILASDGRAPDDPGLTLEDKVF